MLQNSSPSPPSHKNTEIDRHNSRFFHDLSATTGNDLESVELVDDLGNLDLSYEREAEANNSSGTLSDGSLANTSVGVSDDRREFFRPRTDKKKSSRVDKMNFSFVNMQTLTDIKLPELKNITENDHITFFNELNIRDQEHYNTITFDDDFEWVVINEHDNKDIKRRIGLRYPRSLSDNINIQLLDQGYILQDERIAMQVDKSVVQYMITQLKIYHIELKILLVYRLDDSNEVNTDKIFELMEEYNVHMALGDFNIDFHKKELKSCYSKKTNLKQIIKKTTRYGFGRNNTETQTIIDHVWVRPGIASKFNYTLDSVDFTDHEFLKLTFDTSIPPVRITIPLPLNIHRRYFPKDPIDWAKFPLPTNLHTDQPIDNIDHYYASLQRAVKSGCDKLGITFKKKPPKKTVFRFEFRRATSLAKHKKSTARLAFLKDKKILENLEERHKVVDASVELDHQEAQVTNSFLAYKKARNRYNTMAKADRRNFFNNKMTDKATTAKECWKLVNRSKGQVKNVVEDLVDEKYQPEAMAKFFKDRSLLAVKEDTDLTIDPSFPYRGTEPLREIDIKITNEDIDEVMDYKPSPDPDPDSLSMLIWNKLYHNNETYKALIRHLFWQVFTKFHKIPGLDIHDVKLYLKVEKPERQKDLRPVASLPSLPKRMLSIVFKQLKEKDPSIFYAKTDFSGPGRGAQMALINTYERMERCHSRYKQNNKKADFQTTLTLFDKSNAFNTTSRKKMIENLPISGNARSLVCNSIIDHKYFRVRTNDKISNFYELVTGGAQGQCGVAESFSSLTKLMKIPDDFEIAELNGRVFIYKHDYVDDTSQVTSTLKNDILRLRDICEGKMAYWCDELLMQLNEDKTYRMTIGKLPKVDKRFLGAIINNFYTSHDTIDDVTEQLERVVRATRACSSLSKRRRMFISRLQIYSRLGLLPFMYIYASDTKKEELRKNININFKKASYLSLRTPTEMVERYLYGCSFHDYCHIRIARLFKKMEIDESEILKDIKFARGMYRPVPTENVGKFIKLYIEYRNKDYKFPDNPSNEYKKEIKQKAFKEILDFKFDWRQE